jgi:hypothetical protein
VSDLVIFTAILAVGSVFGVLVGMIVAGRIDRRLAPPPEAGPEPGRTQEDQP